MSEIVFSHVSEDDFVCDYKKLCCKLNYYRLDTLENDKNKKNLTREVYKDIEIQGISLLDKDIKT